LVNATRRIRDRFPAIRNVVGIDFSGAAEAGKTAWCAELSCTRHIEPGNTTPKFRLKSLKSLGALAAGDDRSTVCHYLVDRISSQGETLWGCDFPFGLPIELRLGRWDEQLAFLGQFEGTAKQFGRALVQRSIDHCDVKHIRRKTDRETHTPFDCYHYRIIYQTFHGMRDVLLPLRQNPHVCVLPFDHESIRSRQPRSIVVEACPSSTLKRLGLPHRQYKQSAGRSPETGHRWRRRAILKALKQFVDFSPHRRRVMMNDPGGDALDAVLAGVGSWLGFAAADHDADEADTRYPFEGKVYC